MKSFSLDNARADFDNLVARVLDSAEPATVTTSSGEGVVVVPLSDYNSWVETSYLLGVPANASHLRESLLQAQEGDVTERALDDQ